MKKTLTLLAVLFLFSFAPTASAQLTATSCDPTALAPCPTGQVCSSSGTCVASTLTNQATGNTAATGATPAPGANTGANTQTDFKSSTSEAYNGVMIFLMGIFAWLLGVAALTLDYSVYYTVVVMGNFIHNLTAVGVTWRILRDIGNIVLIFGFLAIGITTILNVDWYGSAKKMLPMLLIAAVFLNFSLFISEAVIDVGNLFATQFYTQINGGVLPTAASLSQKSFLTNVSQEGISNKIMGQLGLTTIYGDLVTNPSAAKNLFSNGTPAYVGFMGILLFITAAFVMFSLAFILIARFVALLFLIMLSPVGFAGMAIPQLKSKASLWWSTLFQQTITAPVLLLLLYIALTVITDANFLTGFMGSSATAATAQGSWTGFAQGQNIPGFAGVLLSFLVAMGLLLSVTMFAKKLSAFGTSGATKLAGKLSFGATALGASALLGGTAFGARKALQRYAPDNRATRIAARGLHLAEHARVDVRSIPGVGVGMTALGAGEAAKPIAKSATGRVHQVGDWYKKSGQESDREFDKETRIPKLKTAITANDHAAVARVVGNMSDKELEENSKLVANPVAAAALSQARFDKLLTSDSLSDAQKTNLRKQREAGLTARYTNATAYTNPQSHPVSQARGMTLQSARYKGRAAPPGAPQDMSQGEQAIRSLTNDAVSQLPDAVLSDPGVYENLSLKQLNAISNAGKLQDATAYTIGAFLQNDPVFKSYFATRNRQQQQDLNEFWHTTIPLSAVPPTGGGSASTPPSPPFTGPATGGAPAGGVPAGGPSPIPPRYQQNPGGTVVIPTRVGNGPRPRTP